MMKILRSKEVLATLVGLVVVIGAALGLQLDGDALLAAVLLLGGTAGALVSAVSKVIGQSEVIVLRSDVEAQRNFLDKWAETGGRVHAQAMEVPFIYPDDRDDEEDDVSIYISDMVVDHHEQLAVLRERIEQLEQAVFAKG